ncbi:MAG TPA: hypothetical protein VKL21_11165 [Candidatus Methanoperedens sp.]|nr:hypothetical protein [Candidatus Methanoperedens sp.]
MNGVIYLNQNNEQLVEMTEQKYDSEELLQTLIAKYPNLLAGIRWIAKCHEDGC